MSTGLIASAADVCMLLCALFSGYVYSVSHRTLECMAIRHCALTASGGSDEHPVWMPGHEMTLASHPAWLTSCRCVVQNSSMPDAMPDPSDSLEALVAILSPLFEERCYKSGAYLAREGQAADSLHLHRGGRGRHLLQHAPAPRRGPPGRRRGGQCPDLPPAGHHMVNSCDSSIPSAAVSCASAFHGGCTGHVAGLAHPEESLDPLAMQILESRTPGSGVCTIAQRIMRALQQSSEACFTGQSTVVAWQGIVIAEHGKAGPYGPLHTTASGALTRWPCTMCRAATMKIFMDHFQAGGMPSPHARTGLHPSSSTPALPTHLARMSETADANANYARGSLTAALQHLLSFSYLEIVRRCVCV